jgi:hypothetical protein
MAEQTVPTPDKTNTNNNRAAVPAGADVNSFPLLERPYAPPFCPPDGGRPIRQLFASSANLQGTLLYQLPQELRSMVRLTSVLVS